MDLSIQKSIIPENLRYWSIHSVINAIPSFGLAYHHDWDTTECIVAMLIGILLFIALITFFTSLSDIHRFLTRPSMQRALKVGVWFRAIVCLVPLPFLLLCYLNPTYANTEAAWPAVTWGFDFVTGIISHGLYRSVADAFPIYGVHNFLPTILITIMQGVFITLSLFASGLILTAGYSLTKYGDKMVKHTAAYK